MDATYLQAARAKMRTHGVYLQGVTNTPPFGSPYVYTVGLQRLRCPRPEAIVFACCVECSAAMLHATDDWVRRRGALPLGAVVDDLVPDCRVRVDEVLPQWVAAYAGLTCTLLRRRPDQVPMVQLVLPDAHGRWPEDDDVDVSLLDDQPLLARDPAWQTPVVHDALHDLFAESREDSGSALLAVPVLHAGVPEGRFELLRAELLGDSRAVVRDVPWLADHLSYEAVVEVAPLDGVPALGDATVQLGALLEEGWATRTFRLPRAEDPAELVDLTHTLWDWHERDDTRASTTLTTLHVNTAVPRDFDRAVRPFLRDGLLVPRPRHSEREPLLPIGGCPDCG